MVVPELAQLVQREGASGVTRESIEQVIKTVLPQRDAVDNRLHAVCVVRAIAQANLT